MKALRLQAELVVVRHGWLPLLAALLAALAGWLHFVATPETLAGNEGRRREIVALASAPAAEIRADEPLAEQRYRAFRDHLVRREALPEVIRTFFAEAGKNGLALQQMDYSLVRQAAGNYLVYRISVPVGGPYGGVRRFAQGILDSVPAAALEEADFRRATVASPAAEAKLRFAIYLKEGG